eukprot:g20983.t1
MLLTLKRKIQIRSQHAVSHDSRSPVVKNLSRQGVEKLAIEVEDVSSHEITLEAKEAAQFTSRGLADEVHTYIHEAAQFTSQNITDEAQFQTAEAAPERIRNTLQTHDIHSSKPELPNPVKKEIKVTPPARLKSGNPWGWIIKARVWNLTRVSEQQPSAIKRAIFTLPRSSNSDLAEVVAMKARLEGLTEGKSWKTKAQNIHVETVQEKNYLQTLLQNQQAKLRPCTVHAASGKLSSKISRRKHSSRNKRGRSKSLSSGEWAISKESDNKTRSTSSSSVVGQPSEVGAISSQPGSAMAHRPRLGRRPRPKSPPPKPPLEAMEQQNDAVKVI